MYEVEVKVRADHDAVGDALAEAGATHRGTVTQRDTYYDAPDRDFAETDEALRVRHESDGEERTLLTYKGPLVDAESKTREEHETEVADAAELDGVLAGLGCEPAATVEKERERYGLDGYTVTLDDVAGLGEFVEVEREVPESDVESAREGARALLRELGLDPTTHVRTSYLGLLLDNSEE
ncbi:MAG: class IV adenylate cyclase [Halobacteriaceae archaeon]